MKTNPKTVLLAFVFIGLLGCARISETDARRLASGYRAQWILRENPEGAEKLRIGAVRSIEATKTGWHVVFVTETGHEFPSGRQDYYLHIFIDRQGKLEKVVRGPDLLS